MSRPYIRNVNRPYILGIDPGISGAAAIYNSLTKEATAMTDLPLKPTKSGKNEICISSFCFWLEQYTKDIEFAVIEQVHAMPGQGVTSMFRFGEALGILKGVVTSYMIPVFNVRPAVWKTQLRLTKDKEHSRNLALRLFPNSAADFAKKSDHGKAEAILLALYGSLYCAKNLDSTPSN